jgi:hypothetical protein
MSDCFDWYSDLLNTYRSVTATNDSVIANSHTLQFTTAFDSRHYQKQKVVGLERGPLSLVSTTEELLDRKVAAPI